ncbi:MAG: hypothetical protein MRY21_02885 [Simkaniaceae bacterium]|nr:hypothetical protein [Simkaniaceae bacterium]
MKKYIIIFFVSALLADDQASHTIVLGVTPVNELGLGRAATVLIIDRSDPELSHNVVEDDQMTYSVTTNEKGKKIMAYLDQEIPKGARLKLQLDAPEGSYSTGALDLGVIPVDLVRNLSHQVGSNFGLHYRFEADDDFEGLAPQNYQVTLLLTDM